MSEINYDSKSKMLNGFPKIIKKGIVSHNGEMTPFVFNGRLMRLELVDKTKGTDASRLSCAIIRDCVSGAIISEFGHGSYYFSAYTENDRVYVLCVDSIKPGLSGDSIRIFESSDLLNWQSRILFTKKGWRFFNTSLTKGEGKYVLLLEAGEPKEYVGKYPFTFFFAVSEDMINWEFLDCNRGFSLDRYMGGPWMRFSKSWYYVIAVTELPCQRYTNYIYRTKDFIDWEVGFYNPILMPDENDRIVSDNAFDIDEVSIEEIKTAFISSNSDIDMCDYNGKAYINYTVGNQLGLYYMAEAEYDGSVDELLEGYFI